MVGLPRLHGELGAKRVEVTVRQKAGEKIERVSLKTCQQQHGSLERLTNQHAPIFSSRRCFGEEQPGLASHSLVLLIADCQFPIGHWRMRVRAIGNRKLEIGNEL
jgi:hypothetical protein